MYLCRWLKLLYIYKKLFYGLDFDHKELEQDMYQYFNGNNMFYIILFSLDTKKKEQSL